jgi:CDP-diglyceride synthetase
VLVATSTQLTQVGAVLGAVGAALIAAGALGFLRGPQDEASRKRERTTTLIGALAVCAGFLVLLFAFSR